MGIEQFSATVGTEVGAVDQVVVVANKHVDGKPLAGAESIRETTLMVGIPGRLLVHTLLQCQDLVLRCRGGEHERRIPGVDVGKIVANVVHHH